MKPIDLFYNKKTRQPNRKQPKYQEVKKYFFIYFTKLFLLVSSSRASLISRYSFIGSNFNAHQEGPRYRYVRWEFACEYALRFAFNKYCDFYE